MIDLAFPWVLVALPLPVLIRFLLPAVEASRDAALRVPFIEDFQSMPSQRKAIRRKSWPLLLAGLGWCLLVLACARPEWLGEPIEQSVSGRDLMLAVDLSGSMKAEDFMINDRMVNRLVATKRVAGEFLKRRQGDRIGLILFGENAYLQAPLTFDRKTVGKLLNESFIGLAGDSTAIGDAIGQAIKRLRENDSHQRVLILMTDGANTAGAVTPLKAAELAAAEKLKIYTIGIGADEIIVRDFFGARRVNPSQDLDEKTLKAIAEKTGGQYFRARDTAELAQIYQLLDQLEPVEKDKRYYRPKIALFYWPLSGALLLFGILSWFHMRGLLRA